MWVDSVAVEQATAEPLPNIKPAVSTRNWLSISARESEVMRWLWRRSHVLAVEVDQGMCRRLNYNAQVHGSSERILSVRSRRRAVRHPPSAWIHLDPDRRASDSRRAATGRGLHSRSQFWQLVMEQVPAGAIKLSPAADFSTHFAASNVEIELVSLRGECKEATVWFGELVSCGRRATRLPENVTWSDRDGPANRFASVGPPGSLIYDPDPSLMRAGLLDGFACEHKLNRVADGADFLTANHLLTSPFLTAFELLDVSSLDLKALKDWLRSTRSAHSRSKVRGVDLTPEALRAKLKLEGYAVGNSSVVGRPRRREGLPGSESLDRWIGNFFGRG